MSIIGMTHQRPQFPRIGVLRKGAKKTQANKPGEDLKWFRFVSDDPDAMQAFVEETGGDPATIEVMLPFATTDEVFEAWQEEWGAGSLKHRCDGQTCVLWQDGSGMYHHEPKPCPGRCKPTGRLMVILPALRRLAYVEVLTTSKWDIIELDSNLRAAENTARLMGKDLRGIPFVLSRVLRQISTPPRQGQTNRTRVEKSLLHIEPAPSWVSLQIEAAQQMARPSLISAPQAPVYPNGDDDEGEEETIESTATPAPEPAPEVPQAEAPKPDNGNAPTGKPMTKTEFYQTVLKAIRYYRHVNHVSNTLPLCGFPDGYKAGQEDAMIAALQQYANTKANEEAAAQ